MFVVPQIIFSSTFLQIYLYPAHFPTLGWHSSVPHPKPARSMLFPTHLYVCFSSSGNSEGGPDTATISDEWSNGACEKEECHPP